MKTKLQFQFITPGGFSVEGYGNFFPELVRLPKQLEGILGNTWVESHDINKIHEMEMPDEDVPELPAHIAQATDAETKLAYARRGAEKAAEVHAQNNAVRAVLKYQESIGRIKIIHDSFFDKEVPETKKAGRPAKSAEPKSTTDETTE